MSLKLRSPFTRTRNRNAFAMPNDNNPQQLYKLTEIGKRYVDEGEIGNDKKAMVIYALYTLKIATASQISREANNMNYQTTLSILNVAIKRHLVETVGSPGDPSSIFGGLQ